jgi:DNA modification methylase
LTALKLEHWPIDRLVEYGRNPRKNDDQVDRMVGVMREFGFRLPILAKSDGLVVDGHLRLKAARKLGLAEIPVVLADGLTDAQIKAFRLLANKSANWASWDDELLGLELADLQTDGFNLELTGFSGDELDALLADRTAGLTDPDDAPEPPVNPVTVLGDVWVMGKHRIICGSATDADTVAKALNGVKPHLMVTDPPYGVNYDPAQRDRVSDDPRWTKTKIGKGLVVNDDRADWREAWALFPGDVAYVWHSALFGAVVAESLETSAFTMRAQIIWAKEHFVFSRGDYHWQHEPCWYAVRKGAKGHYAGDRKQTTVWHIRGRSALGDTRNLKAEDKKTGHGTQKPVECMRRPIENNSSPGQAVYEPFSGSGTTIIAAEMTGRACHAIELNPAYVDVAVQRWQEFTGQVAVLEATGQTFADVCEQRYAGGEWAANCAGSYDDAVAGARKMIEAAE